MPTDQLVTAAHVLKAVMELDRRGSTKVMSDLESLEPDLVEYLLESLTRLHHQLTSLGFSGNDTRKIYRPTEKTTLVCIMALRNAHRDLWENDSTESSPEPTDRSPPGPPA